MKVTLDLVLLRDAVAWTGRAVSSRPVSPVLSGMLLEAEGDKLRLSAYDYDVSAQCDIGAQVAEPGRALLPARLLVEVCKSLPSKPVELSLSGAELVVRCGTAEFGLLTMPVEDYPKLPAPPRPSAVIDGALLQQVSGQVTSAASRDTTIPMLCVVRFDIEGENAWAAATDRYRIASRTFAWTAIPPQAKKAIRPAFMMVPAAELEGTVKGYGAGQVEIGWNDKLVSIAGGGRLTTIRLMGEDYIDYRARLNLDYSTWVQVDVAPLIAAVKRIGLVAEKSTAVRLSFSDGQVLVEAGGGGLGRAAETVEAEVSGPPVTVGFLPTFLLDGLTGVDTPRARLGMNGSAKPVMVTEDSEQPVYRYLVMALRLG
ncbi:DNA polymerase III subunit beta [Nonomuraea endophytica]|uniref:Beta sliding clamp n=1 Tax=Nonomuraea endophytica TaxID=714136 RepID=A0A7W8AAM7_9ACTN|nr:DNA polymerase III subunit beta [Nonomuraea endophytica]MBB5081303.1 DNA polymerase-3 subunit beta [Nonomuraea endophytica]